MPAFANGSVLADDPLDVRFAELKRFVRSDEMQQVGVDVAPPVLVFELFVVFQSVNRHDDKRLSGFLERTLKDD